MSVADIATVATAVFTAGAAFYAARAVHATERQWKVSKEPDVHLEILHNGATGTSDLSLLNAGATARAVCFAVGAEGRRATGYVDDGWIKPGERVLVHTHVPATEDVGAFVMYAGMDHTSYLVVRAREREVLRRGIEGPITTIGAEWDRVYPKRPWARMTPVGHQVVLVDRQS